MALLGLGFWDPMESLEISCFICSSTWLMSAEHTLSLSGVEGCRNKQDMVLALQELTVCSNREITGQRESRLGFHDQILDQTDILALIFYASHLSPLNISFLFYKMGFTLALQIYSYFENQMR